MTDDLIERQTLGERLGCPPGIRLERYLEARIRQALRADAAEARIEALENALREAIQLLEDDSIGAPLRIRNALRNEAA